MRRFPAKPAVPSICQTPHHCWVSTICDAVVVADDLGRRPVTGGAGEGRRCPHVRLRDLARYGKPADSQVYVPPARPSPSRSCTNEASALECLSRRPRSHYARDNSDFPLPRSVGNAMLAVKPLVSGEYRVNCAHHRYDRNDLFPDVGSIKITCAYSSL